MIKNERQYRITKAQAKRFSRALHTARERREAPGGPHPLIAKAQADALASQLADLEGEIEEYESLKVGVFPWHELAFVADVPAILIKARIAQGMSQKQLAERVGLKQQQIQRYEATDYSTANLARLRAVAEALYPPAREQPLLESARSQL